MPTDLPPSFDPKKKKEKKRRKMTFFERVLAVFLIPLIFLPVGLFFVIFGLVAAWILLFIKPTIWVDVDGEEKQDGN